jgi:YHS domain-containing protein
MKKTLLALSILVSIQAIAYQEKPQKGKSETLAKNSTDPVCKMTVKKGSKLVSTHKEKQYGFCGKMCKDQFDKHPEKFVKN